MSEPTPRTIVTQADLERAFREAGVAAGDVALVHSSLSSLGWVEDGAETVLRALLAVLDPARGTLVLPTLCQRDKERRFATWDVAHSPSDVGRLTEVGRQWPGALRSDHATHSVAAIGAQAVELTAGHAAADGRPSPWGPAAFGFGSPWERLYELDAHYLFLGTTTSCDTIGHFAQAEYVRRTLVSAGGAQAELEAEVQGWGRPGVWPTFGFAAVEAWLAETADMRYVPAGETVLRATTARRNVDTILVKLATDGATFLPAEFVDWHRRALRAAGFGVRHGS